MEHNNVTIIKTLPASIQRVWDAWTHPEEVKQWLSPEGMTNPEVTVDLKVGGAYRIVMEGRNMPNPQHNGKMAVGGTYLEIEVPTKLVFTWLWEKAPPGTHTTTITILLKAVDSNTTELTLIHTGFPDDTMRHEHNMGWNSTFRKLEQYMKGGE